MTEEKNIERFDAFLQGEMSSSEKKSFLQELKSDKDLNTSFEEHKLLFEAFKRKGNSIFLGEISAAHEAMGNVKIDRYRSHNSSAWRNFLRNLILIGGVATIVLFGVKYWDEIQKLDQDLEEDSMQFGEPQQKERTIRVFVDTIRTEKVIYDTIYKEIKVSGSNEADVQSKLQGELNKIKRENPEAEVEMSLEKQEFKLEEEEFD